MTNKPSYSEVYLITCDMCRKAPDVRFAPQQLDSLMGVVVAEAFSEKEMSLKGT